MQNQSDWFGQKSIVGRGLLSTGIILFVGLVFYGCGASTAIKQYQSAMEETYELQKPFYTGRIDQFGFKIFRSGYEYTVIVCL